MKRRFAINILCIPFLMLVVFLDCSRGSEFYYPLKEGMTWEYKLSLNSEGAYGTKKSWTKKVVLINFAPRELEGKDVTPQKRDIEGQILFFFFTEDSNGINLFAFQLPEDVEPYINPFPSYAIKYPIQVGTTWDTTQAAILVGCPITLKHTIEKVDEVVTVSAGTFKGCAKVKSIGATKVALGDPMGVANIREEYYDWFAPGVGLIKQIIKSTSDNSYVGFSETTMQLESFKK